MTNWGKINAVGSSAISGSTVIAGLYLFFCLIRQGTGKLRTRLLLGMVTSDVLIGLVMNLVFKVAIFGSYGI